MANIQSIIIHKGAVVAHITKNGDSPVTLKGDVYVEASRHDDGCFGYCVGGQCYAASAGTVEVL